MKKILFTSTLFLIAVISIHAQEKKSQNSNSTIETVSKNDNSSKISELSKIDAYDLTKYLQLNDKQMLALTDLFSYKYKMLFNEKNTTQRKEDFLEAMKLKIKKILESEKNYENFLSNKELYNRILKQ